VGEEREKSPQGIWERGKKARGEGLGCFQTSKKKPAKKKKTPPQLGEGRGRKSKGEVRKESLLSLKGNPEERETRTRHEGKQETEKKKDKSLNSNQEGKGEGLGIQRRTGNIFEKMRGARGGGIRHLGEVPGPERPSEEGD